ncbi:MAG: AAA family ATPase, partial [Nitrospiraceae bacterium]|nr:AAA family ATPase [Nitrospiraceae bacterium]
MGLFDNMLKDDETLFRNSVALDYDFVPKLIPFRENEQMEIARSIRPLFMNQNGKNIILFGKSGIGKTVAVKHVLSELEDETDDIYPIYINCWQRNTTYKIMLYLCEQLGYKFTANKNTEELFSVIKKIINQKAGVFVFDEIDKAQDYDFLYNLLNEIYRKSIILITNFKEWITNIDSRIKSRLIPEIIEFKPYGWVETRKILDERVKLAFYPDVMEKEAFDIIVQQTFEIEDIRVGLYLLREAGLFAEEEGSKKIKVTHAIKAIGKIGDFEINNLQELDKESKELIKLINETPNLKTGELYVIHKKRGSKISYKTFQRKIKTLSDAKLIKVKKINGGANGKTSIISPNKIKPTIVKSDEIKNKNDINENNKEKLSDEERLRFEGNNEDKDKSNNDKNSYSKNKNQLDSKINSVIKDKTD